jgi:hypothetical protein
MVASESETAETEAEFLVSQFVNPPITAGINKIIIPPTRTPSFSIKLTPGSTRLAVE